MKIIQKNMDIDKDQLDSIYSIEEITEYFETNVSQEGTTTYSTDNPISSIKIEANPANLTINYGDFGHIHLHGETLKEFVKGINKLCKDMQLLEED